MKTKMTTKEKKTTSMFSVGMTAMKKTSRTKATAKREPTVRKKRRKKKEEKQIKLSPQISYHPP